MDAKPKKREWIFPSPARCPRCKQHNTVATHTDSERGIQYRKCRVAICRWKFSVKGAPVEETPKLVCPHCGIEYQRQGDLTKHINKVHGDKAKVKSEKEKGETSDAGSKSEIRNPKSEIQ